MALRDTGYASGPVNWRRTMDKKIAGLLGAVATLGTFTVYGCAPSCQRFSEEVSKIPAPTPAPPPNNVIVIPSGQQPTPSSAK